jgi:hypothetical protein
MKAYIDRESGRSNIDEDIRESGRSNIDEGHIDCECGRSNMKAFIGRDSGHSNIDRGLHRS